MNTSIQTLRDERNRLFEQVGELNIRINGLDHAIRLLEATEPTASPQTGSISAQNLPKFLRTRRGIPAKPAVIALDKSAREKPVAQKRRYSSKGVTKALFDVLSTTGTAGMSTQQAVERVLALKPDTNKASIGSLISQGVKQGTIRRHGKKKRNATISAVVSRSGFARSN